MAFVATANAGQSGGNVKVWDCTSLIADGAGPHTLAHGLGYAPEVIEIRHTTIASHLEGAIVVPDPGALTTQVLLTRGGAVGNMACTVILGRRFSTSR